MDRTLHRHIFQPSTCLKPEEIQAYLNGSLGRDASRRVENHLLDCPLCSDAVDAFEEMGSAKIHAFEDFSDFKKKLPLSADTANIRQLPPSPMLKRLASVAAVLVVGMVGYFGLFRTPSTESLYHSYYTFYESDIPLNTRAVEGMSSLNPAFVQALNLYEDRNFPAAAEQFEAALAKEPSIESAHFFAGMAYMEAGQFEKAIEHFAPISRGAGMYARKAAWFSILAHIKLGKKAEAKALLEDFSQQGGYMMTEANELKEKL